MQQLRVGGPLEAQRLVNWPRTESGHLPGSSLSCKVRRPLKEGTTVESGIAGSHSWDCPCLVIKVEGVFCQGHLSAVLSVGLWPFLPTSLGNENSLPGARPLLCPHSCMALGEMALLSLSFLLCAMGIQYSVLHCVGNATR